MHQGYRATMTVPTFGSGGHWSRRGARVIDYTTFDGAVGHNWYDLDPELQRLVRRGCPPEDRDWADGEARASSARSSASASRRTPTSSTPTRRSSAATTGGRTRSTRVEHHPAMIDSKRALWESGYVSASRPTRPRAAAPTPGVIIAATHYLVSQADTGLVCSTGMTSGVAGPRRRVRATDVRARSLAASAPTTSRRASTVRCSSPSATAVPISATRCTAPRATSATAASRSTARSGSARTSTAKPSCCWPGPKARPKDRPGSASTSCRGISRTAPQPLHDPPAQAQARHQERADGRGRVPRCDRIRAAPRAATVTAPVPTPVGSNRMMEMVNGSRFGVAMMGLGIARRCFLESRDLGPPPAGAGSAARRPPAGARTARRPPVRAGSSGRAGFECAAASRREDGDRLRRILVPATKARLCRFGVEAASATVELYGGNGYCEDWGITRQLRDAQCHPIWEGSENVCVLDVLRAMRRDGATWPCSRDRRRARSR